MGFGPSFRDVALILAPHAKIMKSLILAGSGNKLILMKLLENMKQKYGLE